MHNIFDTVITGYRCPAELLNENKDIRSFYDQYELVLSKHKKLQHLITAECNSEALRKEMADFYRGFSSKNTCKDDADTAEAAAVASIIKISEINLASRLIVAKALLKGTGLNENQLTDIATDIREGREEMERTATTGDLEFVSYVYTGLLAIVAEMIWCCESDIAKAMKAIGGLTDLDIMDCERIIDAISIEKDQWDKCG